MKLQRNLLFIEWMLKDGVRKVNVSVSFLTLGNSTLDHSQPIPLTATNRSLNPEKGQSSVRVTHRRLTHVRTIPPVTITGRIVKLSKR